MNTATHAPVLSLLLACSSPESPAPAVTPAPRARTLTLAAYTTPREAYGKAILPAFAQAWKAKTGETPELQASHGGSGAQARAVIDAFLPFDFTVVPSGSCGGMISHHYPGLFAEDPEYRGKAEALAKRV